MQTYIIYHQYNSTTPCPDGIAAAFVARLVYPDAVVVGWEYQSSDIPQIPDRSRVIIVDFSFGLPVLNEWRDRGCEVFVIDHHKSAWKRLTGIDAGILGVDINRRGMSAFPDGCNTWADRITFATANVCGAVLTWEYFFPGQPMPVFLEYIQDQDLWDWKLPYSEIVREAFTIVGRSFETFEMLSKLTRQEFLDFMVPIGLPKYSVKLDKIAAIASRHKWIQINQYRVPCVALQPDEFRYRSDVCSYLGIIYPAAIIPKWLPTAWTPFYLWGMSYFGHAVFTTCCSRKPDGLHWDYRSNKHHGNFDVSQVAMTFGGGGHNSAAGSRTNTNGEST